MNTTLFRRTTLFAAAITLLAIAPVAPAAVTVSKVFSNHMVIQQEMPIRVWGWADAGEKVTVTFAGKSVTATTGDTGEWRVDLPAMKADGRAHTLTIAGSNTITLKDVWLGEVWVCSGQSNMEWSVGRSLNAKEEIGAADHPMIRLFNVDGHVSSPMPLDDPRGAWRVCSPETVGGFTAVGYYFGRELSRELNVPIGLVGTNWGGTRIEPWTPPVGFQQVPQLAEIAKSVAAVDPSTAEGKANYDRYISQVERWTAESRKKLAASRPIGAPPQFDRKPMAGATHLYNGMVHALTPLSVRGAIWYQGESNAGDGLVYDHKKEALVKGWRSAFQNPDLSFYWVQLANFRGPTDDPAGGGWGPVREGQRRALRIDNTGMAVIIDIGEARDIHPKNKQDVGKRLALWALAKNYGRDIVYSGPLYKSMTREGSKIRIHFDHVGSGLMTGAKKGLEPVIPTPGAELKRFAIQDDAGAWHWAKAVIDGDTVVVSSQAVKNPKHVRFGYESNPLGINLYNKEGLPASPFTTD